MKENLLSSYSRSVPKCNSSFKQKSPYLRIIGKWNLLECQVKMHNSRCYGNEVLHRRQNVGMARYSPPPLPPSPSAPPPLPSRAFCEGRRGRHKWHEYSTWSVSALYTDVKMIKPTEKTFHNTDCILFSAKRQPRAAHHHTKFNVSSGLWHWSSKNCHSFGLYLIPHKGEQRHKAHAPYQVSSIK